MLKIEIDGHFHGSRDVPRPWVARICGPDPRYGLARDFVQPLNDWESAHRACSGNVYGVVAHFPLRDGLYEMSRLRGRSSKRYVSREFLRIHDGKRSALEPREVLQRVSGAEAGAEYRIDEGDGPRWVAQIRGLGTPDRMAWIVQGKRRSYWLPSGHLYEVRVDDRRWFVGVDDEGEIEKLNEREAFAWLRDRE